MKKIKEYKIQYKIPVISKIDTYTTTIKISNDKPSKYYYCTCDFPMMLHYADYAISNINFKSALDSFIDDVENNGQYNKIKIISCEKIKKPKNDDTANIKIGFNELLNYDAKIFHDIICTGAKNGATKIIINITD